MFNNPGQVVSKFNFSKLFSKAWSKGKSISNICAGFRNTGISPLNCSAILSRLPSSFVVHAPEFSSTDDEISGNQDAPKKNDEGTPNFQPEKVNLFERRLGNGYDVYSDSEYNSWIQLLHSESIPSIVAVFSFVSPLQQSNGPFEVLEDNLTGLRKCKQ